MLNWTAESDINNCITTDCVYKEHIIVTHIYYKDVQFPYSITQIFNTRGECNYSQVKEVWSIEEALLNAEEFIIFMIDDPDVSRISEYLEDLGLNYVWYNNNNSSIKLVFGERGENKRFCSLIGENINIKDVMTKAFELCLSDKHGIGKYTR